MDYLKNFFQRSRNEDSLGISFKDQQKGFFKNFFEESANFFQGSTNMDFFKEPSGHLMGIFL